MELIVDVALERSVAFDQLVDELTAALARQGLRFDRGADGRVLQGNHTVGTVTQWEPPKRIQMHWCAAPWETSDVTELDFRFDNAGDGTKVVFEHRNWARWVGDGGEMVGWIASEAIAPMLTAMTPAALGDWLTDRRARRPSGAQSRDTYRDPLYHYPGFRVMLAELALQPSDYLLEVGCGGGAMLKQALQSGCRAAAVDHSGDMVRTAIETNREAVEAGRLEVVEASAERLPFADHTFTCAAMTGVLGFLREPAVALAEMRRVLHDDGRIVIAGSDPELRGTPGAPEPMASRLQFYDDDELGELAKRAGFKSVRVVRRDLEQHARDVGVPEEHVFLFAGDGTRFLLAKKS